MYSFYHGMNALVILISKKLDEYIVDIDLKKETGILLVREQLVIVL